VVGTRRFTYIRLPAGNRTPDGRINEISVEEQRIVITKDADFVNSFLLSGVPYKLLLVSTGNVNNRELESLFAKNLSAIVSALEIYKFVEITRTSLIEHR
jgi:predicted nuclease of predicted toxin-antitoxin system